MKKRIGIAAVLGTLLVGATVMGVVIAGSEDGTRKPVVASGMLADPSADAEADGGKPSAAHPRADITGVSADIRPEGIAFSVSVRDMVDPQKDRNWSADSTFISWEVDTTGDGVDDYEVTYELKDGELAGEVGRAVETSSAATCPVPASFNEDSGYTVVVHPLCLGNPKTVAYRAVLYYQTDPNNEDAPSITDTAPNVGMTEPIVL